MPSPIDANVDPDQPQFANPIVEGKTWVFGAAWQRFITILKAALRVIDGGTP